MNDELPLQSITISDREYQLLAELIYQRCGIHLGENKKELVRARLQKRIRFLKFTSYKKYYEYVTKDDLGNEIDELIDAVSTNVTSFFREMDHFDFLTQKALPAMIERKISEKNMSFRVWSAASSSGEELYSLLMTLVESLEERSRWTIKALGTDISHRALRLALKGEYSVDKVKSVPEIYRRKYFSKVALGAETVYRIAQELQDIAVFRLFNLMSDRFPFRNKFDVIFCRNVMIYFDRPTQQKLIEKLVDHLDDKGYLFVGHSESLIGAQVRCRQVGPTVYQKIGS